MVIYLKKNYYNIEKNINKIFRDDYTNFLDPVTLKKVAKALKGKKYNIYYPYEDSEKAIIYTNKYPEVKLIEIICYEELTHREIMGSLFGFQIDSEMFGDIIIWNNHYYILIMNNIYEMFIRDFRSIGNKTVSLKDTDISILDNYHRIYEDIEIIVSGLRIDLVISKLIGSSRDTIKKKFIDGEVILNYEECNKYTINLNTGDTFSIRRYGKYKFDSIIGRTKKNNYIINIKKYISK